MASNILLLVDDSPAGDAAVTYAIHLLAQDPEASATIVGLLPPGSEMAPVGGVAYGRRETPKDRVEAEYERDHVIAARVASCRRASDHARERLAEAGVPRDHIHVVHEIVHPGTDVVEKVVGLAHTAECAAIVVTGLSDSLLRDYKVAERLVRRLRDVTLCVVH